MLISPQAQMCHTKRYATQRNATQRSATQRNTRVFSPAVVAGGSGIAIKGVSRTEMTHSLVMQFNINAIYYIYI